MQFVDVRNEIISLRFNTAQSTSINYWINAVNGKVWALEEWTFKNGRAANLTTTAGSQTLGNLPTDLGPVLALYDQNGERLVYMPPRGFFTLYANQTGQGQPIHFTIVNGVVYLGPIPNVTSSTFVLVYQKRIATLVNDADVSPLPVEHHYPILVAGAMVIGLALYNDFTFDFLNGQYQEAIEAMRRDYLVDQRGENEQWGRDAVDSVVLGAAQWTENY